MRAIGLNVLAATCLVGLTVATPVPAGSQSSGIAVGRDQDEVVVVKEAGYRREQYRDARPRWRYRYATRPYHFRRPYHYFGADPDRYFGVGPGAYECYGYDCNW